MFFLRYTYAIQNLLQLNYKEAFYQMSLHVIPSGNLILITKKLNFSQRYLSPVICVCVCVCVSTVCVNNTWDFMLYLSKAQEYTY